MQIYRAARTLTAAILVALASISCSSTKVAEDEAEAPQPEPAAALGSITKVKPFHLEVGKNYFAADPAIPFELKYHLHGAVTSAQFRERYGHYYTIFWETVDHSQPVTVRFEYRQKLTGPDIRVIEVEIPEVDRRNETKIEVTGEPYFTDGAVSSWRVSLVQGGSTITSEQSFLWE